MNCVLSGTKISILFHLNDEIVKKTAEKTSFLTFQGDFFVQNGTKNVRLRKMAWFLLHIIAI